MAASATVRVYGVNEVSRAFRTIDRDLAKSFGNDLKAAAAPVVTDAKRNISRYQGASLGTIRAKRVGARVFVSQDARKVTGFRPDYGALQMTHGLIPALNDNATEVFAEVDHVLNRYADRAGF